MTQHPDADNAMLTGPEWWSADYRADDDDGYEPTEQERADMRESQPNTLLRAGAL